MGTGLLLSGMGGYPGKNWREIGKMRQGEVPVQPEPTPRPETMPRTPPRIPPSILVTDHRRLVDPLPALAHLPRGAAVVLRHYDWPQDRRLALLDRLRCPAHRRGLTLIWAGPPPGRPARGLGGVHLPEGLGRGGPLARILLWRRAAPHRLLSMACHGALALGRARALGCDLAVLSPVAPTASHPGAPVLGPLRAAGLARGAGLPVAALGGLSRRTAGRLPPGIFAAIAGIFAESAPRLPK
jgi:thiamine-phosphate pyrophosphorylase